MSLQMKNVYHSINCLPWTCGLLQQKDGIRSFNQEYVHGSSMRKKREEHQSMGKDKVLPVAEAEWKYLDVNEHWQQVKNTCIMM